MNDEEYEDDDDDFEMIPFRLVESKPVTKYTFIQAGFTLVTGILRTLTEICVELSDAYIGAEGHVRNTKRFEDEARLSIESIVDGSAEE